LYIHILVQN